MRLFLASISSSSEEHRETVNSCRYMLESYVYFKDWQIPYIKSAKMFLLDSGAFTFRQQATGDINWLEYLNGYIDFINKHDVKYFFELDIDSIVGYKKVLEFREILERKTGKKCIPVWHKSRGLNEYIKLCKEYDYIAIGGITGVREKNEMKKVFPKLLKISDKYNTKVHALGFTGLSDLDTFNFYSADSSSWTSGGRYGTVYSFKKGKLSIVKRPPGVKTVHYKILNGHNLKQWIKWQHSLDKRSR